MTTIISFGSDPDFSMPRDVLRQADSLISASSKLSPAEGGPQRLYALELIGKASSDIDPDSAFRFPARIHAMAMAEKFAPARAMMLLFEARTVYNIYRRNAWKYDRVEIPDEPLPSDMSAWSGRQFKSRISTLIKSAAEESLLIPSEPVTTFRSALEGDSLSDSLTPTVPLFVMNRGAGILRSIGEYAAARELLEKALSLADKLSEAFFALKCQLISDNFDLEEEEEISVLDDEDEESENSDNPKEKALRDLYLSYADSESARYVLVNLADLWRRPDKPTPRDKEEFFSNINLIDESLEKFPDWYGNGRLRKIRANLLQPSLIIEAPDLAVPDSEISVRYTQNFTTSARIELRKLPLNTPPTYSADDLLNAPIVETYDLKPTGLHDYNVTDSIEITLPGRATWVLVPVADDEKPEFRWAIPTLRTVDLIPLTVSDVLSPKAIVADASTGAPAGGVQILYSHRKSGFNPIGATDASGVAELYLDNFYNSQNEIIRLRSKGQTTDYYRQYLNAARAEQVLSSPCYRSKVMTSRSLYHQGDTIEWAAIVICSKRGSMPHEPAVPARNYKVNVQLNDANGKKVDSDEFITNDYGRIYGSFKTLKDGLTGNYSIEITDVAKKEFFGRGQCMVSDFKLPTFNAEITTVERDRPEAGGVILRGRAATYAGMPVAGASVSVKLTARNPWWRMWTSGPSERSLGESISTSTDAQGCFSIEVPASTLAPGKSFFIIEAEATVTAPGGESQFASRSFTLGKPYCLSVSARKSTSDGAKPLKISVAAHTPDDGEKAPALQVSWQMHKLSEPDKAVLSGTAVAGTPFEIDASGLEAGKYIIQVNPKDSSLADECRSSVFTLYNSVTGAIPPGEVLFVPDTEILTDEKGNATVLVGVNLDEAWIYTFDCREVRNITPVRTHKLSRGFHRIPVKASTDRSIRSSSHILMVHDCSVYNSEIRLQLPAAPTARLTGESLRDKTVPGASEKWTLRLSDTSGKKLEGAAVATMYNRALDALRSINWPDGFNRSKYIAYINLNWPNKRIEQGQIYVNMPRFEENNISYFDFRFINNTVFIRGLRMMNKSMASMAVADDAIEEVEYEMAAAGAPVDMTEGVNDLGAVKEATTETSETGSITPPEMDYRVAELLQAFWKPDLTTNADGSIDINFTAPNAIGAWTFRAFAWTAGLEGASLSHELVAAKPVMIQPTLPRFARCGDSLVLTATMFNNSEDSLPVTAAFDIRSLEGKPVASKECAPRTLAPGESAVVEMTLDVPMNASSLSYKIWADSGSFRDGEQGIIPVLSSESAVIESETFYLNPEVSEPYTFETTARKDFIYTLQYCQNPVWTIVKAMRGNSLDLSTAPGIVSSIFSNLAALRIISDNPGIAAAIKQWRDNPSEKALESMLSKNEDLKAIVLGQTPWVAMAENETARMAALADYLDREAAMARVDKLFGELQKLQSEGGLKWASWCDDPSYWATEDVLITLGIARSMGLAEEYDRMIDSFVKSGLSFIDSSRYVLNAKGEDLMFAYLHSLYMPETAPSTKAARALMDRTVEWTIKQRSKLDTVEKAYAALILKATGKRRDAEEMARSIMQFGVTTPDQGMSFPSVDDIRGYATIIQALSELGAPKSSVDAMRQWIIVRAQAMDDLGAFNPDYVIAAVMLTGTVWTDVPVRNAVSYNGSPLEIGQQESASGYFSTKLPASGNGTMRLSILPNGVTPSYGSLIGTGTLPATEIAPRAGRDLSVEKRIMVNRDGSWTEVSALEIAVGERVRVDLEIRAGRDLEYVTVTDERPAGMEPVEQLPGWMWDGGAAFYRENRDASTRLFISYLSKGTYHLSYEQMATTAGTMASGICTVQSQLAPEFTAHSGGCRLTVVKK